MKNPLYKSYLFIRNLFKNSRQINIETASSPPAQTTSFSGTVMTLAYNVTIGEKLSSAHRNKAEQIIAATFAEVDSLYNKWNPHSEISKLNNLKAGEKGSLSPAMETFLILTDHLVKATDGKFDPTIEPLQRLWRRYLIAGKTPPKVEIDKLLPAIGWNKLHFDKGIYTKQHDNTRLDLGGVAKGHCVDLLTERLVDAGFENLLVDWEGEIRAHGIHPEGRPWHVMAPGLEDCDPDHAIAHIDLHNQAVATSGDYVQNWKAQRDGSEKVFFHVMDPCTGEPLVSTALSVASATVVAPTCLAADVLATAALMFPRLEEALLWAEGIESLRPGVKFWLFAREEKRPKD
jgi:thiamine biosynthesis lipoprotein